LIISHTPFGYSHTWPEHAGPYALYGEVIEPTTGNYLLGNGYRTYAPAIGIFHSPDSWSPFNSGGLNSYAYCNGDPINYIDRDGHARFGTNLAPKYGFVKPIKITSSFELHRTGRTPGKSVAQEFLNKKLAKIERFQKHTQHFDALKRKKSFTNINTFFPEDLGMKNTHKNMLTAFPTGKRGRPAHPATAPHAIELEDGTRQLYAGHLKLDRLRQEAVTDSLDPRNRYAAKINWQYAELAERKYYIDNYQTNLTNLPSIKMKDLRNGTWIVYKP
jgi:RHS repeat-associated protein